MTEMNTEQLFSALKPYADAGRLTGVVYVDGVLLVDTESGGAEPTEYDDYGFSLEMSEYGCVRIKVVDELLDEMAGGDEADRHVAGTYPRWFSIAIPGRDYEDDVYRQLSANIQNCWEIGYGKAVFEPFRVYGDMYKHRDTGETKNKLTMADRLSRKWGFNPEYYGAVIETHQAVGWGNSAHPDSPLWKDRMADKVPVEIVRLIKGKAESLRKSGGAPGLTWFDR